MEINHQSAIHGCGGTCWAYEYELVFCVDVVYYVNLRFSNYSAEYKDTRTHIDNTKVTLLISSFFDQFPNNNNQHTSDARRERDTFLSIVIIVM